MKKNCKLILFLLPLMIYHAGTCSGETPSASNRLQRGNKNRNPQRTARRSDSNNYNRNNLFNIFNTLDKNNDKVVSKDELLIIRNPQRLSRILQLDSNGDGELSYQEVADQAVTRVKGVADSLNKYLQMKIEEKITEPIEMGKLIEAFSVLQPQPGFFDEFDLNQDNKIDRQEAINSLPKLVAATFARRVKILKDIVGSSPEKHKEDKFYFAACAIDYNADETITAAEFKSFVHKALGKEATAFYRKPLVNTDRIAQPEPSGNSGAATQTTSRPAVSTSSAHNGDTQDDFIIPEFSTGGADDKHDPLQEMLGDTKEAMLW